MLTIPNLLIIFSILMVLSGVIIFYIIFNSKKNLTKVQNDFESKIKSREHDAEEKLNQKIKDLDIDYKGKMFQLREKLVDENKGRSDELQKIEERLTQREEVLDKRRQSLDSKDFSIEKRFSQIQEREKKIEENEKHYIQLIEQENLKLERISGLTAEDAKKELMQKYEEEAKKDIHEEIKKYEEKVKQNLKMESQKLIASAAERFSNDYVAESLVSVVSIPSEEMKGRIIGREGRNIRALEMATGVDIIVDDTPEAVVVSAFDKVRREIARLSLEYLVEDGRIHPGRIEEVVKKTTKEIENLILQAGKDAVIELSIKDVHPELIKYLGRMKYRTSYSQNALEHSKEVAHLAGILANELGLDPYMAKRAGLFHDIGKSATHEIEGSHVEIGYDMAKRFKEPPQVLNAIVSHHEDEEPNCIESVLVKAADTLSAARPGARREIAESYVKRLEALEGIANSFKGVEKCYALQAGREIRVSVLPESVSDSQADFLARDIAKRIESEQTYPGEIIVTVIRETRHMATAH